MIFSKCAARIYLDFDRLLPIRRHFAVANGLMSTLSYPQIGTPMQSIKDNTVKQNQRSPSHQHPNYGPNEASPTSLVHFYHEINKPPTHCQSDLAQMASHSTPIKQMRLIQN